MRRMTSAAKVGALAHALRAAGQAAAVAEILRSDASFEALVQQLLATRGSLDSLLVRLAECELARLDPLAPDTSVRVAHVLRTAFDRSHRKPDPAHRRTSEAEGT